MGLVRRNRHQPPDPVSVSARLVSLPLRDLIDYAEVEIMMAGFNLSVWRDSRIIDPTKINQAVAHAEMALEALRALEQRDKPGLAS